MLKVDIGSGVKVKEGFVGLDKERYVPSIKYICNLEEGKLPFKDNSVDEFSCEHVLEHLNYPEVIVGEIYRCLKVGGKAHIVCPYFSFRTSHIWCHKNYWSVSCAKLFDKDLYHETKIKFSKMKIRLTRDAKFPMSIIRIPFIAVADFSPALYETLFCYIFPLSEIHFDLEK